ncbi:PA2928 family protein [Glycomyces dulcitolivorans]|uniref:PA2928 family protein n=1 Tax=Glycomyces dulcitolivorans TaxID=2200759 RepID=UPI000DD439E5|nr:PA2928 family protein [Glycomyces dulcitolivorans]
MFQDFRAANPLPAHSQLVSSPYGTPDHPLVPKRRGRGRGFGMFFGMVALTAGVFAVANLGEFLTSSGPDVVLRGGIAFSADGLALVPYERTGSGGLIDEMRSDMFEARLAAVDLASGETRWDVKLAGELEWDAAALAAGAEYAYLATEDGLQIRDLDDGALVTDDVPGLEYAGSGTAAYGFDPAAGIIALDVDGGFHSIALDTLEAVPADPAVAEAWTGRLFAEGAYPEFGGMTSTSASIGEERTLNVEQAAAAGLGSTLAVEDGGDRRALGTRVYYEAGIVLDQTTVSDAWDIDVDQLISGMLSDPESAAELAFPAAPAAGAASGHALIEHRTAPGGEDFTLTVVDLDTGQATASLATADHLGRSMTGPGGYTVVIAAPAEGIFQSDLVIVAPDGSVDRAVFGEFDLLGEPDLD